MPLAEITPEIPWAQTIYVAGGLIAILALVALGLNVAIGCKKLFGKQPPMHEQIAALRTELIHEAAQHEAEDEREINRLEQRINSTDAKIEGLRESISSNGERRKTEMLGHIESVRTKLDTKIDTQTAELRKKIDDSTAQQTKTLIGVLKGKHD